MSLRRLPGHAEGIAHVVVNPNNGNRQVNNSGDGGDGVGGEAQVNLSSEN